MYNHLYRSRIEKLLYLLVKHQNFDMKQYSLIDWLQNWLQWPENGRVKAKLVTFLVTVEVGSFRNRLHKLACLIWPL